MPSSASRATITPNRLMMIPPPTPAATRLGRCRALFSGRPEPVNPRGAGPMASEHGFTLTMASNQRPVAPYAPSASPR
jgi:hypothetical protein